MIEHDVLSDAPFVGARITGISCNKHCPGCFNQHLLNMPFKEDSAQNIIKEILKNPFNEGVIFGGLEWTEQPKELEELIEESLKNNLKVIVYTNNTEEEYFEKIKKYPIYVKFGEFKENSKSVVYFGVTLASENQKIINFEK